MTQESTRQPEELKRSPGSAVLVAFLFIAGGGLVALLVALFVLFGGQEEPPAAAPMDATPAEQRQPLDVE